MPLKKTELPLEKIKNDLAGKKIPQQGGMKMRRREKPDADIKLILLPCLCDLNEMRAWTRVAEARLDKTPR